MKDDGSSNAPGTVRKSPTGDLLAIRVAHPAAWVVVNTINGSAETYPIRSWFAGDIYKWPVVTHGRGDWKGEEWQPK